MLVVVGTIVLGLLATSTRSWVRERDWMATVQFSGACLLTVMVLTHVCETFQWLPSLGWGRPSTIGHYIDLLSANVGVSLLLLGYSGRQLIRRRSSSHGPN